VELSGHRFTVEVADDDAERALYFDNNRRLISQQRDVPPCSAGDRCPPYPSEAPARYVLELNAGEAARMSLANGSELRLGPEVAATP
jgi:uncharacterized membrane protein (UPF0127 family)